MISLRVGGFILAAFIAGAFLASPELRAYAANTVFSTDIKDGEVKTPDLANNAVTSAKVKDGEIKAAEIATNAVGTAEIAKDAVGADEIAKDTVGASELMGVDKLIFADCNVPAGLVVSQGIFISFLCTIAGVDSEDNAIATMKVALPNNTCFDLRGVDPGEGEVTVLLRNICTSTATTKAGTVSVIVYDELPDKIPPTLP